MTVSADASLELSVIIGNDNIMKCVENREHFTCQVEKFIRATAGLKYFLSSHGKAYRGTIKPFTSSSEPLTLMEKYTHKPITPSTTSNDLYTLTHTTG